MLLFLSLLIYVFLVYQLSSQDLQETYSTAEVEDIWRTRWQGKLFFSLVQFFEEDYLNWKEIYSLPYQVAHDTKSREFQYKLLHRYLATNDFLNKIGISSSPRCSLCDGADESLEHLFVSCLITQSFWAEVIKWCSNRGVVINHLSAKDILFGIKVHKDNLFINHILLVGKQYIYNCRCTKTNPCLRVFLARLNNVYQLETIIAKSKNKMSFHLSKWQALLTDGTQLPTNTC